MQLLFFQCVLHVPLLLLLLLLLEVQLHHY
jgi:hypothetical protein